ncbi:MAG: LacI family DNA-binding transcriptional regulator [Lachnospiraceae bacterium]|nr:LacI family DNA-binding transcriptional regulator [Lachnospiraceae bacterium]
MRAKITDVAKMAHVSSSTVSHVLNNTRFVSDETKRKVMEVVDALGYSPDASGRTFRTGKKMMIGLIVPDITNSVFASIIEDVDDIISQHNYNLVISNTRDTLNVEKKAIRTFSSGVVDGLIIASTAEKFSDIKLQMPDAFPTVFIDRILKQKPSDSIALNCTDATQKMLEDMIINGHKNIGYIVGISYLSPTIERVNLYKRVMDSNQILPENQNVYYINNSEDSVYDATEYLIKKGCTAIVATNTAMTHGVLNYLEESHIQLGKEMVVGGFVDSDTASRFMNRIPVVYEPMHQMGRMAGEMIIQKIDDPCFKTPIQYLTCTYCSNNFYNNL